MTAERNPGANSSWAVRRKFMFAVTAFCMSCIAYILHYRLDTKPAETVATMAFVTLISTVGSYVFGAAWEDVSLAKTRVAKSLTSQIKEE